MLAVQIAAGASASELTPEESRGKQVYFTGDSPSGDAITAYVGRDATPIPGFAMPCANCHGEDGLGKPERGVIPPDITWDTLTKPYDHVHVDGRHHPPFAEESLAQAVTRGVDPAGNALDLTMPRYEMSEADLRDLVAYLKHLGRDLDPGLSADRIRVGSLLPLGGRMQGLGEAMRGVLEAYFRNLNARGGVFGREIELVVAESAADPAGARGELRRLIEDDRIFALVGAFTAGAETDIAALVEQTRVPLVGPFTLFPSESDALARYTFYLLPGLREQARVLVAHAATASGLRNPVVAILHPGGDSYAEVAEAARAEARARGWAGAAVLDGGSLARPPAELVRLLQESGTQVVLFLGFGQELAAIIEEADRRDWHPYLLLPGSLAGKALLDAPAGFADRIFLAYPSLPADQSPGAARAFADLHRGQGLPSAHMAAQISVYSAAQLLVEGLKRAGRNVSREKLIEALEGLHAFRPGLTPPLSYGPNRRVGALGGYIVGVDLEHKRFRPLGDWIALDD